MPGIPISMPTAYDKFDCALRLIREQPGWSTAELATFLEVPEDVLYVYLYRRGRAEGVCLSALRGWVPSDDPQLAGIYEFNGQPCPDPTEDQLEAERRHLEER
jgi:hypothetical protein